MSRHTDRYKHNISLFILPDLIAEIDAMESEPDDAQRAEMITRCRTEEHKHHGVVNRDIACQMVNGYLIDTLWRTRDERNGKAALRRAAA